jgi:hypothetical protein
MLRGTKCSVTPTLSVGWTIQTVKACVMHAHVILAAATQFKLGS